jgi:hypothetical protein
VSLSNGLSENRQSENRPYPCLDHKPALVCCISGSRNRIAHERVQFIVSVAQHAADDQCLWKSLKKCNVVATSLMPRLVAPAAHVGAGYTQSSPLRHNRYTALIGGLPMAIIKSLASIAVEGVLCRMCGGSAGVGNSSGQFQHINVTCNTTPT